MGRLKPVPPDSRTAEQRRLAATRPGGRLRGPWSAWIRVPELFDSVIPLMDYFRTRTGLPPRLVELATLVPIRAWTAQFAWALHEKDALKAGLDPAVVEAIKARRTPVFAKADEAAVYALATALVEKKSVDPATYDKAVTVLGEEAVVILTSLVGFFAMVSGVLSTFDVDVPEGTEPPLLPLKGRFVPEGK
jgi:4-carboxymuconolactone decarboxylase